MMQTGRPKRKLVLNTAPIEIPDVNIHIGRQEFEGKEQLLTLRQTYRETHIFKRRGDSLVDIPVSAGAKPIGRAEELKLTQDFGICKALILKQEI